MHYVLLHWSHSEPPIPLSVPVWEPAATVIWVGLAESHAGLQGIKVKSLKTFITKKEMVLQAITVTRQLAAIGHQGIKMHSRNVQSSFKKKRQYTIETGSMTHIPHLQ